MSEILIAWYEGWGAVYRNGVKVMESDDSGDIYREVCSGIKYTEDHDVGYDWHDDPEVGGFPDVLP